MKTLTFVSLFILFSVVLSAQTPGNKATDPEKQRIFLNLAGGLSWPTGKNYTDLDRNNTQAGYSEKGYFLRAEVDWMGKKDLGIAFQYTFQHNPLQDSAKTIIPSGSNDSLGRGSWANHYLLIGPYYMKTISKFVIEAKLLIGMVVSFSPVYNTSNPETHSKESNHGFGLAWGGGIGLGYNISPRMTFLVNVGYMAGYPKATVEYKHYVYDSLTQQNIISLNDISFKKSLSAIHAGFGLIYKF